MLVNQIRTEVLEGNLTKTVSRTVDDNIIIVDFVSVKPKISMQRLFKNDFDGNEELKTLEKTITSLKELMKLMGL